MKLGKFVKAIQNLDCVNPHFDIQFFVDGMEIAPVELYLWDQLEHPCVAIEFMPEEMRKKGNRITKDYFKWHFLDRCDYLPKWMKDHG